MRTIVHATLNFGLIYVPVGVATAQRREEVKFRTLHVDCGHPISQAKVCKQCDMSHSLIEEELVSGYEVAKDQFVVVDDDIKASMRPDRDKSIILNKFVEYQELDPVMVEKTYWLIPNQSLYKPYEVLLTALAQEGLVGIGRMTLWGKEYPCAVDADRGALALRTLFCADELISPAEITLMLAHDTSDEEVEFAKQFLTLKKDTITVEDLTNVSRTKTLEVLARLAEGQSVPKPAPEVVEPVTVNMLEKLKEMVSA